MQNCGHAVAGFNGKMVKIFGLDPSLIYQLLLIDINAVEMFPQ